jgi:hypothetical protein
MPKANDIVAERKVSMLLKGSPGFGKTIAACSVAIEGPIWLAYFDKSQPVELLSFYKKHRPELLANIEYDVYTAKNANDFLNKLILLQSDCRYVATIVDSVTNLTSAAVNWSMGFRDPKGPKKDSVNNKSIQLIPEMEEYKTETSFVSQALDLVKALPCHMIWTAHPLPTIRMEGSGKNMRVTKVNNIVSYGSKVAGMIPGNFNEIYHFSMDNDYSTGSLVTKRIVSTVGVGDDFAKTVLDLPSEFDITDKLFWETWRELAKAKQ